MLVPVPAVYSTYLVAVKKPLVIRCQDLLVGVTASVVHDKWDCEYRILGLRGLTLTVLEH